MFKKSFRNLAQLHDGWFLNFGRYTISWNGFGLARAAAVSFNYLMGT